MSVTHIFFKHHREWALDVISRARRRIYLASFSSPAEEFYDKIERSAAKDKRIVINMQTATLSRDIIDSIRYLDDSDGMHHKFIVSDDVVMFGSYNFSSRGKYETSCIATGSDTAEEFASIFEELWANSVDRPTTYSEKDLRRLVEEVAELQGGWSNFTINLLEQLRTTGRLSVRQIARLKASYQSLTGNVFSTMDEE